MNGIIEVKTPVTRRVMNLCFAVRDTLFRARWQRENQAYARARVMAAVARGHFSKAARIMDHAGLQGEFPALVAFASLERLRLYGTPAEREAAGAALPGMALLLKA
ncbi:hypothetical protein ACUNXA_004492 [Salmonella enterica subsp. enterica serovar Bareilly]|uniref:hypothetical protein n=1 Tax=Aeromonas veronii TaxID=654 RepID=UPI003D21CE56